MLARDLLERKEELAERRKMVAQHPEIHGIDFVSLESDDTIFVHFIKPHETVALKSLTDISSVFYSLTLHENGRVLKPESHLSINKEKNVIALKLQKSLDISENASLHLELDHDLIDRFFSQAEYTLKDLFNQNGSLTTEVSEKYSLKETPRLDYLAKDYDSFKTLIENELSFNDPSWKEKNPADMMVMISEVLAYAGDYLSYEQDTAATEAYLSTARLDRSIKRHSRLLDYSIKPRANSRTWVQVCVKTDIDIPQGTPLLCGINESRNITLREEEFIDRKGGKEIIYETMHAITALEPLNEMKIYDWGLRLFLMKKGATEVALEGEVPLHKGDVIIFSSVSGKTQRQSVRLIDDAIIKKDRLTSKVYSSIKWHREDALREEWLNEDCVVYGNIVMADRGETVFYEEMEITCINQTFYSMLNFSNLVYSERYDHSAALNNAAWNSLKQNIYHVNPAITLFESAKNYSEIDTEKYDVKFEINSLPWIPVQDFLASTPYSRHIVVEEEAEKTYVRFGDGVYSSFPSEWNNYFARYRITAKSDTKIAAEAISQIYTGEFDDGILKVTNLVSVVGDYSVESHELTRKMAPLLHKSRKNLAIPNDYINKLVSEYDVRDAFFKKGWSGSREVYELYIYPIKKMSQNRLDYISQSLAINKIIDHRYSLLFYKPLYLHVLLDVKIASAVMENSVLQKLRARFLNEFYDEFTNGFFNPENFTFGTGLYKSEFIKAAMEIDGVESVKLNSFQKLDDYIGRNELEVKENIFPVGPEVIALRGLERSSIIKFSINGGDYV